MKGHHHYTHKDDGDGFMNNVRCGWDVIQQYNRVRI